MIVNGSATVAINELECEETYTVTAGGTLNGTLVGQRFTSNYPIFSGRCMRGETI